MQDFSVTIEGNGNDTSREFEIKRHGLSYFYRYVDRGPGPLFVSIPSSHAAGSSVRSYARTAWSRHIPCSFLFAVDPMWQVGAHVKTSAFQGRPEFFIAEELARDVKIISERFGHPESRMLVYGSSIGGLAAVQIGTFLRDISVIAECPMLSLRKCEIHRREVSYEIAQMCYDAPSPADVPQIFDHRLSASEAFKRRGMPAHLKIFVRESDTDIVDLHVRPLVAEYPSIELQLMDDRTGSGHIALQLDEVKPDVLKALGLSEPHSQEPTHQPRPA